MKRKKLTKSIARPTTTRSTDSVFYEGAFLLLIIAAIIVVRAYAALQGHPDNWLAVAGYILAVGGYFLIDRGSVTWIKRICIPYAVLVVGLDIYSIIVNRRVYGPMDHSMMTLFHYPGLWIGLFATVRFKKLWIAVIAFAITFGWSYLYDDNNFKRFYEIGVITTWGDTTIDHAHTAQDGDQLHLDSRGNICTEEGCSAIPFKEILYVKQIKKPQ